jgi:hypothetical protein
LGPGDESFDYRDPATGRVYHVPYDYSTDPDAIMIERIELDGKRMRAPRELKRLIEIAVDRLLHQWQVMAEA